MSANQLKTWLVCYDISEPRRLRHVHRILRKEGATVQYSAFAVRADDRQIQHLLERLRAQIDERRDDVRAYHLPDQCPVWTLGCQHLPEGVEVDSQTAAGMLLGAAKAGTAGVSAE